MPANLDSVPRLLRVALSVFAVMLSAVPTAHAGFSIADATVSEGNSGTVDLTFAVQLDACPLPGGCSVFASTFGETATEAEDFTDYAQTLHFDNGPAGPLQTRYVQVVVHGDTLVEADEVLRATLSHPDGAQIDDDFATGVIENDDGALLSIQSAKTVQEGTTRGFGFILLGTVDAPVTMVVQVVEGTAEAQLDFEVLMPLELTIPAYEAVDPEPILIEFSDDAWVEADETLTFELVSYSAAGRNVITGNTSMVVTIENTDEAMIQLWDVEGPEGDLGPSSLQFVLTMSAPIDVAVWLDYRTEDGTATSTSGDYADEASVIYLDAGVDEYLLPITVHGDETVEPDEYFLVRLTHLETAGRAVTVADDLAFGVIVDDDGEAPIFSDGFESGDLAGWTEP